jgi:Bacterial Ig-like domain (group 3)
MAHEHSAASADAAATYRADADSPYARPAISSLRRMINLLAMIGLWRRTNGIGPLLILGLMVSATQATASPGCQSLNGKTGTLSYSLAAPSNSYKVVFGTALYNQGDSVTLSTSGGSANDYIYLQYSPPLNTTLLLNVGGSAKSTSAALPSSATYAFEADINGQESSFSMNYSMGCASALPTLTSVTANTGSPGTSVAIAGTGFYGATAVTFGALAATNFTINSATSITATTPAGTGTQIVHVTTDAGTTAATSVTYAFVVGQTISAFAATPANPTYAPGGTFTVGATSSSGLPVAFSIAVASAANCSITGSTITTLAAGICTVLANQAGNANYTAAPQASLNVVIAPSGQTINFGSAPSLSVGGTGNVSATATSNLPVSFSTTSSTCTVTPTGTVNGISAGACSVNAAQAGNANYLAAPVATQMLSIAPAAQTISFGNAPSITVGGTGNVSATATSNLPVSFSTTSSACTVTPTGTVTGVAAGSCSISAAQAGNVNYQAAPAVTQGLVIGQATSSTVLVAAPNASVFGQNVTFTATVSGPAPSGLVNFSDGATLLGSAALNDGLAIFSTTGLAVGTHTITAAYAGDANVTGSSSTAVSQNVTQASTTTTIAAAASITLGEALNVTATVAITSPGAGTLSGAITISDGDSGATDRCTITLPAMNCALTPTTAGSKTLTATYAPDAAAGSEFGGSVATANLIVNSSATAMALSSSANPGVSGQSILFTATLTPTSGGIAPTWPVAAALR